MKVVRTVFEADLARLKQERHEADRRYNEALTALDAAIQALPLVPAPPVAPDETQVTPLNERWAITDAILPLPTGLKRRLARFVLRLVQPALDQQQAFNAALVDHMNRNVAQQRAVPEVLAAALVVLRAQVAHLTLFETRLISYLQQITPYIDTKDYEFHGLATRVNEDVAEAHSRLSDTVRGLAAALDGVSDQMLKRMERGEVRYQGLSTSLASMQVAVQALRREVASRAAGPTAAGVPGAAVTGASPVAAAPPPAAALTLSSDPLSSHKYLAFEDAFRGDRALIRARQAEYVPLFAGRSDVLDVGCGRGEFLQLLSERGISGRGIDLNHEMVAECLEAGLNVRETDAVSYLRGLADGSLGGLIAAQVVEHLEPDYLIAMLDEAFRALRPGSPLVLETINVTSWSAFFSSYIRDLTHIRPIHPDTLKFLVLSAGFLDAEIQLRAPMPESEKLRIAPPEARVPELVNHGIEGRGLLALSETFQYNMLHLNQRLFAPLDYAVVGWKR